MKQNDLLYYNDFGGFSNDSKEYVMNIKNGERTPAPWSHVIANEKFGTIITSNGGGYTWSNNSRENKITNWSNNQISDNSSEMIYIKTDNNIYSAMPETIKTDYTITYGFGYAVFETSYENIEQKLTIFVPDKKSEKISILKLKNNSNEKKKIKVFYKLDLVLGVNKEQTKKHIIIQKDGNVIEATNRYRENYSDETIFITCSDIISSATGEKEDFNLHDGIIKESFGIAKNPFATIETNICIEPYSEQTIYFSIGTYKRELFTNIDEELKNVSLYWKDIIETIQVKTPVESMNIIMNGWLLYQTICCRLYARTSFYQCGGAFGFRDQLQDVIGIMTIKPELAKKQILYHAEHQFVQGDVLHWWHPEKNNGIRSRYKDDLLWLPYVVNEYVHITGDNSILDEEVSYICGKELKEDEDELYEETTKTDFKESIYSHCIKAIEKSLDFGLHGLPQMGGGDWNDGMNKVGGESIWLGFFLYDILKKFSNICEQRGDISLKEKFVSKLNDLRKSLNENAWDGKWYKRAFFKDGVALGTAQAEECKIDGISQSWAVISGAGDYEKTKIAMDSVDNYLVDKENMIIKLLTPPFNQGTPNPGYISAYIPGIRENGGQYTHGAIWAIIANAILKNGNRAGEYFRILNPIEHSRTKENAIRYKVEPYVVSADVYSSNYLLGRGGWTWYTGSSSWLYIAGLTYILGFRKVGNKFSICPSIPETWNEYQIVYKFKTSIYEIMVRKNSNAKKLFLDNNLINNDVIDLIDDGKKHTIDVEI